MAEEDTLDRTLAIARHDAASRGTRPVWPTATLDELRAALGGALPRDPVNATEVVESLDAALRAGEGPARSSARRPAT